MDTYLCRRAVDMKQGVKKKNFFFSIMKQILVGRIRNQGVVWACQFDFVLAEESRRKSGIERKQLKYFVLINFEILGLAW